MDVFTNSLIPASVRALANMCEAEKLPLKVVGSWRVFTKPAIIDSSTRTTAIFSTSSIEVKHPCEVKWLAAEKRIVIRAQIGAGCKIGTREVYSMVRLKEPIEVECDHFLQYGHMGDKITFKKPCRLTLFGVPSIPAAYKDLKVTMLPMPREALPSGAKACMEETGFSIWHLIALGLFPQDFLEDFLETTLQTSTKQLLEDLSEYMGILDDDYKTLVNEKENYPFIWRELKLASANRSVQELCNLSNKKLFDWYTLSPSIKTRINPILLNFPQ